MISFQLFATSWRRRLLGPDYPNDDLHWYLLYGISLAFTQASGSYCPGFCCSHKKRVVDAIEKLPCIRPISLATSPLIPRGIVQAQDRSLFAVSGGDEGLCRPTKTKVRRWKAWGGVWMTACRARTRCANILPHWKQLSTFWLFLRNCVLSESRSFWWVRCSCMLPEPPWNSATVHPKCLFVRALVELFFIN